MNPIDFSDHFPLNFSFAAESAILSDKTIFFEFFTFFLLSAHMAPKTKKYSKLTKIDMP